MKQPDLIERTKRFALAVMELCEALPAGAVGWNLSKQLMRSGTSIGANYRESQRARTKPEFVSKIAICQQEAAETVYWLDLVLEYRWPGFTVPVAAKSLANEAYELCLIFSAIGTKAAASLGAK